LEYLAWINTEVNGASVERTGADTKNELLIFRMNNGSKSFWSNNSLKWANKTGGDNVFSNVVIGKPTQYVTEAGAYNVSEVMCFNGSLTEAAIGKKRTFFLNYYFNS